MSDPNAEVEIREYMVACYGTTEYTEDMTGIKLTVTDAQGRDISLDYEYKCREMSETDAKCVGAVIPQIETKVTMRATEGSTGIIREGYAFSPMFTLGFNKIVKNKEVYATWLRLEKAD